MRIRLCACAVGAIFGTWALASSALAEDYLATFTTGDEDFDVVEYEDLGEAPVRTEVVTHVAVGGNPGGFIRYEDPDSGASEDLGHFRSPAPVDPDQLGGTVSFDFRSTAPGGTVSQAYLYLRNSLSTKALICLVGQPQPGTWTSYSVRISADEPCWTEVGSMNPDAGPSDFEAIFNDPASAWEVSADRGDGTDEVSDLDNFRIDTPVERSISIRYRKRSETFKGAVSAAAAAGDCVTQVPVRLYQKVRGKDKRLGKDVTDSDGRWKVAQAASKNGKYYAVAPDMVATRACLEATSPTIEPL